MPFLKQSNLFFVFTKMSEEKKKCAVTQSQRLKRYYRTISEGGARLSGSPIKIHS
jgi:hypothetical protein